MQRAGEQVWQAILERWPHVSRITIFAGPGNNGGDAFVVALCARTAGLGVQLVVEGDLSGQTATASGFRQQWLEQGGQETTWSGQPIEGELIVDGLLGIGLTRSLNERWQSLSPTINQHAVPRVAIDIPSGLNGLTGVSQPIAVNADLPLLLLAGKPAYIS